jgi:hypothetical protein
MQESTGSRMLTQLITLRIPNCYCISLVNHREEEEEEGGGHLLKRISGRHNSI